MNILVFSWRGPGHPLAGGAEQVMHEHMKGWVASGHSVTFFTSSYEKSKRREVLDEIEIVRFGEQMLGVHVAAFFWYFFGKHRKFDLVVDQFHGWPFFTPIYLRLPKIAVIQELTREVWFKYPLPYKLNLFFGGIGYLLEPLFFVFYRNVHFMTGSASAKEELSTVGIKQKNITVVPHGVILQVPKKLPKKEKRETVIFLGALAKDKGIEDAIKTFGHLKSKNRQFWIVGKGDETYLKFLKKLVKENGVEKQTTFWGFVSQEKKFELLARAHIMVNPSIREGWGLVNIEANAVATPVVGYTSKGLVDSIKHGKSGFLVSPNTPQSLAAGIESVFLDKANIESLQKSSVAWSKQFTWEKSKKQSLKLLEKIANER